jgi:hypothetical protein
MYEEYDNEIVADGGFGPRMKRFRDVRRMKAIDPVGWVEVRDATEGWFHIGKRLREFGSAQGSRWKQVRPFKLIPAL